MGNVFGHMFRITTWGESHGDAVGVTIDGCPPGIPLEINDIQIDLNRRRPGQSEISTQRKEGDKADIRHSNFHRGVEPRCSWKRLRAYANNIQTISC